MTFKSVVAATLLLASGFVASAATYTYKSDPEQKIVTASIRKTGNGLPECSPGTAQHSGFVTVNATVNKEYFYWAFGPRSGRADAPVILWMTGGPGCSSALAALVELGPCWLNTTTGKLDNNAWGWNNDAYLIFIDQPAGVGFSTSDAEGYASNEEEVSEDMYWFLQEFFYTAHPEFNAHNNEFHVFGESYGGHYAPATAHKIFKRNQEVGVNPNYKPINLVGLGVGNGLTVPNIQYQFYSETAYEYCIEKTGQPCVDLATAQFMNKSTPACIKAIDKCVRKPKDILACTLARGTCTSSLIMPYTFMNKNTYDIRKECKGELCYNLGEVVKFMNTPATQDAFGVKRQRWAACNALINIAFTADWFASFDHMVAEMLDGPTVKNGIAKPVRTMIYVGEMDFVCNLKGNKEWTLQMEWAQKAQYNAARDVEYRLSNASAPVGKIRVVPGATGPMHFSFVHVYDAGHMVPMDQPEVMYNLLDNFLNNKAWKL